MYAIAWYNILDQTSSYPQDSILVWIVFTHTHSLTNFYKMVVLHSEKHWWCFELQCISFNSGAMEQ